LTLDEAIAELRRRNEPVPNPPRLPTDAEVTAAENALGIRFHADYRRYLLQASDISYGVLEPVTITVPRAHTDLISVTQRARSAWNVPNELVPVCEDNADLYCVTPEGRVIFWSHDTQSPTGVEWSDLAAWIEDVWMNDYDAG
jgi:hypothetical protein